MFKYAVVKYRCVENPVNCSFFILRGEGDHFNSRGLEFFKINNFGQRIGEVMIYAAGMAVYLHVNCAKINFSSRNV